MASDETGERDTDATATDAADASSSAKAHDAAPYDDAKGLSTRELALLLFRTLYNVCKHEESIVRAAAIRASRHLVIAIPEDDANMATSSGSGSSGSGNGSGYGAEPPAADPDTKPESSATLTARQIVWSLVKARTHLCAVRSMCRGQAHVWERLQALKLLKRIIQVRPMAPLVVGALTGWFMRT